MPDSAREVVLGSRSPRRRALLSLLVPDERIKVCPPLDPSEPGFDGVGDDRELSERLLMHARIKSSDVIHQLKTGLSAEKEITVLTADTIVVATDHSGCPVVLGQPPGVEGWRDTVREWFETHLMGRTHSVMTAVCVSASPRFEKSERIVTTHVSFRADSNAWLEWYLNTNESIGKAGGYALQGAGSLFVERIDGSPSNVIGLPLLESAQLLQKAGVEIAAGTTD